MVNKLISKFKNIRNALQASLLPIINRTTKQFNCPICGYSGPFLNKHNRLSAICPNCRSNERHRFQFLALVDFFKTYRSKDLKVLHFAPEPFFEKLFKEKFNNYESADISMSGVTHNVDLQELPFEDNSYDFIFASHVLEHVQDDIKAINEIKRVLKPSGIAMLPVPILAKTTEEFGIADPKKEYHFRSPGEDYFNKYKNVFLKVELISSDTFSENHSLEIKYKNSFSNNFNKEILPICYK